MCGIAGFIGLDISHPIEQLNQMAKALHHRGPDDKGIWFDDEDGIGLAHTRLAIIDLSAAGRQPMISSCGRYVMTFNGEIYNHKSLKTELDKSKKNQWRGHSDSEIVLEMIAYYGLEKTLQKSVGMFVIAVWDRKKKRLSIARDRMGEKPLYYGFINKNLFFASELSALKSYTKFNNNIDTKSLSLFLNLSYVPAPNTIYEDIYKVEPGQIISFNSRGEKISQASYWSFEHALQRGFVNKFNGSLEQSIDELENLLMDSISLQMESDVPLGAFLSGGIDSSIIVALMQNQCRQKVKTFSIGFDEKEYNEAEHARAVASHLKTEHYDVYVNSRDALNIIPLLPKIYDEPFADSSQIPTYLVSKIANEKVTVCLSGDAGDELFGGYNRYKMSSNLWRKISKIPYPMRVLLGRAVLNTPLNLCKMLIDSVTGNQYRNIGDKIHKGALLLNSRTFEEFYLKMLSNIRTSDSFLNHPQKHSIMLDTLYKDLSNVSIVDKMMAIDIVNYLPNNILTKVDRAAMATSLETRIPFLDHRIVEFAISLPLNYKIKNGVGKWILRQLLNRHVPKNLTDRPKMGFSVPLEIWLRKDLKDWGESLLDARTLTSDGFFQTSAVRTMWEEHVTGRRNWSPQLWKILMFQAWKEENF